MSAIRSCWTSSGGTTGRARFSTSDAGLRGRGTGSFIGGTGKFSGIEGRFEHARTNLRFAVEGTCQAYSRVKGQWKLP